MRARSTVWLWVLSFFGCLTQVPVSQTYGHEYVFHHENVLGTSLELRISTEDKELATRVEGAALLEIDRLNLLLSHYTDQSEFSRFLKLPMGKSMSLSKELQSLLHRCEEWKERSRGAFDPATELLSLRWRAAKTQGRIPTATELQGDVARIAQDHWKLDRESGTATRCSDVPLSLNAIAKGYILDSVCELVTRDYPGIDGFSIVIGGDVRVAGKVEHSILIANPRSDAIGATPLQQLVLQSGAVATSGPSERYYEIGGERFSHIINPRQGMPVQNIVSASVIAKDGETADVLATICNVLPVAESLALVQSVPGVHCMLVDFTGTIFCSPNWPSASSILANQEAKGSDKAPSQEASGKQEKKPHEFLVEFEINKSSEGSRYRRPYVAVWVEDKDGFPVKTLSLFLMTDGPGPRWHRDLRRWYAGDQMRLLVDPKKMIGTVSKPTRNPGSYRVQWDGLDDNGQVLKEGTYTLYIEAAREHGTYQLMKHPFEFNSVPFEKKLEGNVEIKSASIHYKKNEGVAK